MRVFDFETGNEAMQETLSTARAALRKARKIVIFTGAGTSAESGIPTFRDAMTGLWARFSAEALATPEAFARDPELIWGWYEWRRAKVLTAEPNAGHHAIADFACRHGDVTVVTQNVDDLHERAGTPAAIHLHGSLFEPRCVACHRAGDFAVARPQEPEGGRRLPPPRCAHCDGMLRPGVVWFGESLPGAAWAEAMKATDDCDALIVAGTSALVYPAAELPVRVAQRGATVIQVNPHATALDTLAHFNLHGPAGSWLPRLLSADD